MNLSGGTALPMLILIVTLGIAEPVLTRDHAAIGRKEAMFELNELRKLHESHVQTRSVQSETDDEEAEIDLNLLKRVLNEMEEEERGVRTSKSTTQSPTVNGEELIQEALKGNVDPNSEVVDLIESMLVDEGSRHNQHPDGIEKIASKKGKVYGDTHDGHHWTKQQLKELNNPGGRKRNFGKSVRLWTEKIIPYTIDSSLYDNSVYVDVINKAVKQFSDYTCLRWVPRGSPEDTASYSAYIEFFSGSGCWSYVGRVSDGKQQISLQAPSCVSVSTTVHEMAHAIGQLHEQSRNDRDNHVTMMWSNIQGGQDNINMKKDDTHDYNPYDYESVLQYSLNAFSNGLGPAMVFRDQRLNFLADSATGLMFYDIQDITDAYDCTAPCKGPNGDQPLKQCQNGGFVLHTCNCHCPDGLTGTLCEIVVTDPVCGQGIVDLADGESRTITSPNFDQGGPYPTGKNCVWLTKVPTGKQVGLTINQMDLTTRSGACDHWLEIQYNLIGQTGPRRCGKLTSSEQYITSVYGTPDMMLLKFDSAFAASATAGKGFSLTVSAVGSGSGNISCDFESETCMFRNSPSSTNVWIRHMGSTPSSETGPSTAKSGMYYLYAETSYPVATGSKFHFEMSYIKGGSGCLTFWYHMYGLDMGSLNILRNGTQVWTRSGDQGDTWYRADVDIGTTGQNYNITFEAVTGTDYRSDIAIDDVSLTSSACGMSTTQVPTTETSTGIVSTSGPLIFSCTFEYNRNCFLTNVETDDFDWSEQIGRTPSINTGPNAAFEGSYYGYIEASACYRDERAILESPTIPMPSGAVCLSFAYHMYGLYINTLEVLYENFTYFYMSGDQGNQWRRTKVTLTSTDLSVDHKVQFIGTCGDGYQGDIAIDDVRVTDGKCSISTTPSITSAAPTHCPTTQSPLTQTPTTQVPTTETSTSGPTIFSCTFENNTYCFLTNVRRTDDFDWSERIGRTPSPETGPDAAFEGSYYGYIDASACTRDERAILETPTIPMPSGAVCLTFAYHMYGLDINTLEVVYDNFTYFNMSGDQGNQWKREKLTLLSSLDLSVDHKIQFIGTCGDGYKGNIAIDNVRVTDRSCVLNCSDQPCVPNAVCIPDPSRVYRCECLPPFSGLFCDTVTGQVNCTFEDGVSCFLVDSKQDDFDWTIKSGNTPSSNTGPSSASEGSKYAYIEVSGKNVGALASLESTFNFGAGPRCLAFDYHMYGATIGSLQVLLKATDGWTTEIFSESGQQSSSATDWKTTAIDLYHFYRYTIVFEAKSGNSFTGDIAVDNIRYIPGNCGCDVISCLNGGTCLDTALGARCSCPPPYTGARCETMEGLIASCTFDGGFPPCFLRDVGGDDMDWTIGSGATPSRGTGPSQSLDGKYAYVEASGCQTGNKALLSSENVTLRTSGPTCLSFYYNMNGLGMGTLNVWAVDIWAKSKVGTLSGDQGDVWTPVEVNIPASDDLAIIFEGLTGRDYKSEMAIDTIRIFDKPCTAPSII